MGWDGPMTHRQFQAWEAWQDAELNRPNALLQYLAQIACEVRRTPGAVWGKPTKVELKDLLLKFRSRFADEELSPGAVEAITLNAKMAWAPLLAGGLVEERRISRAEARRLGLIE